MRNFLLLFQKTTETTSGDFAYFVTVMRIGYGNSDIQIFDGNTYSLCCFENSSINYIVENVKSTAKHCHIEWCCCFLNNCFRCSKNFDTAGIKVVVRSTGKAVCKEPLEERIKTLFPNKFLCYESEFDSHTLFFLSYADFARLAVDLRIEASNKGEQMESIYRLSSLNRLFGCFNFRIAQRETV